jgi:alkylation response protein AidB-like acyl-CoA dehydrogenase
MDLDLGPEIARFRAELRDWIAAEAPDGLAELADWNMAVTAGGYRREQLAVAAAHPAYAEWERKLAAARLICPQWPEEYGGQGMDAVRLAVLNEEFHRAGLPIRQMSGASEFCEDFLDGVRAPLFNVIGGLNNGWRVAMTTLGHERGGQATTAHLGYEREFWELVDTARKYGKTADALLRPEGDGYPTTTWQNVFLSSRAGTIYSGTSEIQRNIIGERGLGLSKEPKVAG